MPFFSHFCLRLFLLVLLCCVPWVAVVAAQEPAAMAAASRADAVERARAGAAALVKLYDRNTGLFTTTGWWNSANAVTALADESRVADDKSVRWVFPDVLARAPRKFPGFLNEFYDDEGWWALAWLAVYDLHPHGREAKGYLHTSEAIFDDMSASWDDTCGGGIWWKKDRHYKNAIANELFLSVAAKLALRTRGKQRVRYLDWADREWRWFAQSGMINGDHLVNDGLDSACKNNGRRVWSYNQGVVLGGLAALSRSGKRRDVLGMAGQIAHGAMTHLSDAQGVLHDACEPNCGEDGVQFKGIFTRNLAELQKTSGSADYVQFLEANAASIWTKARTPENRFGTVWSGPPTAGNAAAQTSALDALVAAASVSSTKR